jgi:multicomponent Na+:H+ antiporter subunit F
MTALVAVVGVLIAAVASLARLVIGPTLHDRAVAARAVMVQVAVLAAGVAALTGTRAGVDVAFALYLGAVILSIATLKFFRARAFQPPLTMKAQS